ncbi:hypothetical protein HD806DRAFT_289098 [Xylariaceae sp. AK1471]|nr:hypothetical protein HD806DRAFT_289098 [Xylariaceae sp. AK1471]
MFLRGEEEFGTEVDFFIHTSDELAFGYLSEGGKLDILGATLLLANRSFANDDFSIVTSLGRKCSFSVVHLLADDPDEEKTVDEMYCLCIRSGYHPGPCSDNLNNLDMDQMNIDNSDFEEDMRISERWTWCEKHVFGVAVVKMVDKDDHETYRRIGLFHLEGNACIWEEDDSMMLCRDDLRPKTSFEQDYRESLYRKEKITLC